MGTEQFHLGDLLQIGGELRVLEGSGKIAGITSSPWLFARAVFKYPAMPAPPTRWLNCFDNTAVILTINSWLTKSAVPIALTFPISN